MKKEKASKLDEHLSTLTQSLIDSMESGIEWVQDWNSPFGLPKNMISQRNYNGVNIFSLLSHATFHNFQTNIYLTYKQAENLGTPVRKGEKGAKIIKAIRYDNDKSKNTDDECCDEIDTTEKKYRVFFSTLTVFNISQLDDFDVNQYIESFANSNDKYEHVEAFISSLNATILHQGSKDSDRAYYRYSEDIINMPKIEYFNSSDAYYATLLHEIAHWTGHESRLNRLSYRIKREVSNMKNFYESYAYEELVAELSAVYLCSYLGIRIEQGQHAAYLSSWVEALKEDKGVLKNVANEASLVLNYLMKLNQKNATKNVA